MLKHNLQYKLKRIYKVCGYCNIIIINNNNNDNNINNYIQYIISKIVILYCEIRLYLKQYYCNACPNNKQY